MPLNIQESEERQPRQPGPPPVPPGVDPAGPPGGNRKLLFWIFGIVVLASASFLLIQYGVVPGDSRKGDQPPAGNTAAAGGTESPSPSTAGGGASGAPGSKQAPPADAGDAKGSDARRAAELRQKLARGEGDYTIFISAFASAPDAEELAGRWERAGYPAFVDHSGSWYRVGLGRYATAGVAKEEAEKLRQAFEEGYWIGRSGAL